MDSCLAALLDAWPVLSLDDLRAVGVDRNRIEAAVRRGQLVRLWRGTWASPTASFTARLAAVAALHGGAVLCGASAARLWDLEVPVDWPEEIALSPDVGRVRSRPAVLVRARPVPPEQRTVRWGLPVTSLGRTILDIGTDQPAQAAQWQVDQAFAHGLVPGAVPLVPGRRNSAEIQGLLIRADPRSPSPLVSALRVATTFLPRPAVAYDVTDRMGRRVAQVELAWPGHRVAVLTRRDGREAADLEQERVRRNSLAGCGWVTFEAGWPDVDDSHRLVNGLSRLL